MNTKRAWVVALVTIVAGVALALVQNKVAPCMDVLQRAFSMDMGAVGLLSSLFSFVGIIIALPAAALLNKLGPTKAGAIALVCAVIGSLMGLFIDNTNVLMASRIVEGMGVGLIGVIGPSLITMWFPEEKRGLPMSIWAVYQMGAQAVMFFLGAPLTTAFGWQGMWWFGIAACLVALVLYLAFVKSPRPEASYADVESEDVSLMEGIRSGSAWVMSFVTFAFCLACFGFVNWIATCWADTFGWGPDQANMWVGYFSLIAVVAAIIIGSLLNHIKNRKAFGIVGLVSYAIVALVGTFMPTPVAILAFVIVYPFCDASFPCVLWTMTAQTVRKPELAGVAMGIVNIGFNAGILAGPPIVGAVVQAASWHVAGIVMAGACIVGAIALLFVKLYDVRGEAELQA